MLYNELTSEKVQETMADQIKETMPIIAEEWAYMYQQSFRQAAAVAVTAGAGANETVDVLYDSKHAHITKTELLTKLFNSCDFVVEKRAVGNNQYEVSCEIVCNDPAIDMGDPFVSEIIEQWMECTDTFMNYFY